MLTKTTDRGRPRLEHEYRQVCVKLFLHQINWLDTRPGSRSDSLRNAIDEMIREERGDVR